MTKLQFLLSSFNYLIGNVPIEPSMFHKLLYLNNSRMGFKIVLRICRPFFKRLSPALLDGSIIYPLLAFVTVKQQV